MSKYRKVPVSAHLSLFTQSWRGLEYRSPEIVIVVRYNVQRSTWYGIWITICRDLTELEASALIKALEESE